MKLKYRGQEIECSVEEFKVLIGKPRGKYKMHKKGEELFIMSESHKNAIRKGLKRSWRRRNKNKK